MTKPREMIVRKRVYTVAHGFVNSPEQVKPVDAVFCIDGRLEPQRAVKYVRKHYDDSFMLSFTTTETETYEMPVSEFYENAKLVEE